jgi:hypothetical protein
VNIEELEAMLEMFRSYPVAVSTTGCDALVVPGVWVAKVRLLVEDPNSETAVILSTW